MAMTKDEIIRMAREASLLRVGDNFTEPHRWGLAEIERFAALVAAAEREACAKVCVSVLKKWQESDDKSEHTRPDALDCEAAIRARGQE